MLHQPVPFGDRAYRITHPSSAVASAWAEAVRRARLPGIVDVVAAYETVAVFLDPERACFETIVGQLCAVEELDLGSRTARMVCVPTLYDVADLSEVASRLGLNEARLIAEHSSRTYLVAAIGFRPGFPYLEELSEPLRGLHRRSRPREAVPAGSVAIVGKQTAIYPENSPGGWHLIGRTPIPLVDLKAGWFAFGVGDLVQFQSIDREGFEAIRREGLYHA